MDITITPGLLNGAVNAIPSKSQAHRLLICASFVDTETELICPETNKDIEATVQCLNALGSNIKRTENGYQVTPISLVPDHAQLPCGESGSTLRFMLPIVGALGVNATFILEGRLPQRPLSPLWEEMERSGCYLSRPAENLISCTGMLQCGTYQISGDTSSQFITGLLIATALMEGTSHIQITGKLVSKPYVDMTKQALSLFGVTTDGYTVTGARPFQSPGTVIVEGDWSNAAFFLTATSLGSNVRVGNTNSDSAQGDKAVVALLEQLKENQTISAADIPDLVPILSVVASCNKGAVFTNIQRLRLKESDRVESVIAMLRGLGGNAEATEDTLTVYGTGLIGGSVDSVNDHRIAMSTAIAATACKEPVILYGAQCVEKSYPRFFEEYRRLGGNYEQYLR